MFVMKGMVYDLWLPQSLWPPRPCMLETLFLINSTFTWLALFYFIVGGFNSINTILCSYNIEEA